MQTSTSAIANVLRDIDGVRAVIDVPCEVLTVVGEPPLHRSMALNAPVNELEASISERAAFLLERSINDVRPPRGGWNVRQRTSTSQPGGTMASIGNPSGSTYSMPAPNRT